MARKPRVEWEGASYHVMARGNERARIFHGVGDYRLFLKTLDESLSRFGVELHAWCLMPDHFHLAVTTPRGNLSRWMAWVQTTFTARYNRMHRRVGHLFQGRYRAELVEADTYARQLVLYIHLNPVRRKSHGMTKFSGGMPDLDGFIWSGHTELSGFQKDSNPRLSSEWNHYWGRNKDEATKRYRKALSDSMRSVPENWGDCVERGLVAGGETFKSKVLERLRRQNIPDAKRWRGPLERTEKQAKLMERLKTEKSRPVIAWVRMRLLGERGVDIAAEMGFEDGSGVTQAARRTDLKSKSDLELRTKMESYRRMIDVKN